MKTFPVNQEKPKAGTALATPAQRAAEILRLEAKTLKDCHTVGGKGDWSREPEAKAAHDEMLAVAAALLKPAGPATTQQTNEQLDRFSRTWKLNGDWMTCVKCKRSLIASRSGEELSHGPDCPNAKDKHPWIGLFQILQGTAS